MDVINISVSHQKLRVATNLKNMISGTQEFIKFCFELGDEWDGLTCFTQFRQGDNSYNQLLDSDNCCYLPAEIMPGTCTMMLYGTGGNTIGTTNYLTFTIDSNNFVGNAQSTQITQSLYQQMVNLVQTYSPEELRSQINLKANRSELTAETQRAQNVEGNLQTAINDKASSSDLNTLAGRVTTLENNPVDPQDVANAVEAQIAQLIEDEALANLSIGDGTISRSKVDINFEQTLTKADNAMQPSVYDPNGYGSLENPIDPYSFAQGQDATNKNSLLNSEDITIRDTLTDEALTYNNGLVGALTGVLTRSKTYSNALLANYTPFEIRVLADESEKPLTGATRTFYLIPKTNGNGYDKWWYITDENGNPTWDQFGSSTTVIVDNLNFVGDEDVDYILNVNDEYNYYKYIDSQWVLIAGSNANLLGYNESTESYNSYLFGQSAPTSDIATAENYNNGVIYLDIDVMVTYTLAESSGSYTWESSGALVENPSSSKDYFVKDASGTWGHFRYIDDTFEQIGSSAYSRAEVDELIQNLDDELSGDISDIASDVSSLQSQINNLANMVVDVTINNTKDILTITYVDGSTTSVRLDTGIDIDSTAYNIDGDQTLHFYDSNSNELQELAVVITGGGGGGGSGSGGSASIGRITNASVQTIYGDECEIQYTVIATDSNNDGVGDGVGTLYINNVPVESGFTVQTSTIGATNKIEIGEYLSVGTNNVKISVSVDTGGDSNFIATKTWSVTAINMSLSWNYSDSQINTSAVTDYYTPYGALAKTIYTFIDVDPIGFNPQIVATLPDPFAQDFDAEEVTGINYFVYNESTHTYSHYVYSTDSGTFVEADGNILDVTSTNRSGIQQSLTIPMQTHGSHTVVRYISGVVNGVTIKTAQQMHDMVFVVAGNSTPIIATSFNTKNMTQYNTVQIPIVVYDPASPTTNVTLKEDGNTVSTWIGIDRTVHHWNYSPTTYGTKVLTITCGSTTKTITIEVSQLDIDEAEVSGYDFRFKASEMATNDAVKEWSSTYIPTGSNLPQTVNMTFSNNFDWVNGGLHSEMDENGHLRQYFCVRAGTTVTFNYNLFGRNYDPKQYGKAFKFIFKAVNCRTYDGNVLTCMDTSVGNNGVGLIATANEVTLTTMSNSLKTYYCKDSYTEFEFNIHPNSEYPYLQFWMDGSHDCTKIYDNSDSMQQTNPVGITVGSPNCDVYIYMIKAYPTYLTNENELSNFIMDAPNAYEMVDRYDRNDILGDSGDIDYIKLANANPNLHIILLDMDRMTTGKKDNCVAHTFRHIYNAGGASQCFTVNNACVTVQGTSSVGYLESAGNVDINFKNGRTFTSDNESYTTSQITFDDGTTSTSGFSMTANSIPVDYLNVKVNVASSENANNACIADWYNTYQPWISPVKKKKAKSRDTIEFVPGVIFIRDRSGNLFYTEQQNQQTGIVTKVPDTSNYRFYGICDIGNSKKNTKVFHDTSNPIACCVEVANNTSLPCLMSSKQYMWNSDDEATVMELDPESGEMKEQKVYEFRYVDDDSASIAESAWDRFVAFLYDHNPNLATNNALAQAETFESYTFKGSGTYDTSSFDSDEYSVVYLYGYGLPAIFNNGVYSATSYVSNTTEGSTCYYYIDYETGYIYSSNGTAWSKTGELTWTADLNNVLRGTSVETYAGTYTTDSYNYRMAYLLEHCEEYMVIDPVIYHFIFIESFLMTDNVAKNTFWSSDDLVHWEPSKDYDNDTALGNDNVGGLSFTYGLETDDQVGNSYVFNAHDAAWITFARGLFKACQVMYINRESAGCFNTENFLTKLNNWQKTRPERVWVADSQRKYLRPYEDNGHDTYIKMLAGRKTHQREQVKTYNAYYYASKYVSNFCTSQNVMVRGNTPYVISKSGDGTPTTLGYSPASYNGLYYKDNLTGYMYVSNGTSWIPAGLAPTNTATLSMYINCYIVVASTSYNVVSKIRAVRGQRYVMDFSTIGSMGETELYFCTAPMITELSGLAHLYFKQNNFGMGTNIQRLEIGSNVAGYSNPNLENLTIGTNKMLEYLDVRNCPNATGALDLSECISLSEVYLENTSFTGISFATGGLLEVAHLPSPTSITMRELIYLEDLTLESANSMISLRIENNEYDNSTTLTIGATTTAQSTKDITLNLIQSSPNLSRVRLVGLDWIIADATILNRLYNMAGIDADSYDVLNSVLTGYVYVGTIGSSVFDRFHERWPYLEIEPGTKITQYAATFMNANGNPIYNKRGNAYIQYVDSGEIPYNPITMGYTISESDAGKPTDLEYDAASYTNQYYLDTLNGFVYQSDGTGWNVVSECDILAPAMESTSQYIYTYTGWDNLSSAMSSDRTITAQYLSTLRTYTVTWYRSMGVPLQITNNVEYGSEVSYSDGFPVWIDNEGQFIYRVFKGWDKSTGFIKGDTDVYAVWDEITALPPTLNQVGYIDLKDMTPAQIYAASKRGANDYFEAQDYFEFEAGHDFNFSNVESQTLVSTPQYFDGSNYLATNLQLFAEDAPSFTLAIDYEFGSTLTGRSLVSCYQQNRGFTLRMNSSGHPVLTYGGSTATVGYLSEREVLVLRHKKGNNNIWVYAFDTTTSAVYTNNITRAELSPIASQISDGYLTFGAERDGSSFANHMLGWIYWAKVWFDDLGDENARWLASWPHETWRYEYIPNEVDPINGMVTPRYNLSSSNFAKSNASFIANAELTLGRQHRTTSTNVGGYPSSDIRPFLNGKVKRAYPFWLQSLIKEVIVNSSAGNQSTDIVTSNDYVYLESYAGLNGGGSVNDTFGSEGSKIPFFINNQTRVKFRGIIRKSKAEGYQTIVEQTEPTRLSSVHNADGELLDNYTVKEGDVWINTSNSSYGYIYISAETKSKHLRMCGRTISDSNIVANDGGLWVCASTWWSRSPTLGNTTTFWYANTNGYLNTNYANYTIGVVPSLSI